MQSATAISQPIPKFKEGTKFLDDPHSPRGVDKILMYGNRGERIVTAENNEKHWDKYEAIETGNWSRYLQTEGQSKILAAARKDSEDRKRKDFASEISDNLFLNFSGMTKHDAEKIRSKGIEITNVDEVAEAIAQRVGTKKDYGRW